MTEYLSNEDVSELVNRLIARHRDASFDAVWGLPRGGVVPAVLVSERLGVPMLWEQPVEADGRVLVVDDLVDSGSTAEGVFEALGRLDYRFDALLRKPGSPAAIAPDAKTADGWVVFPWELEEGGESGPTDAVRRILQYLGEDPTREGLLDTPKRVLKSLAEMTVGYGIDPAEVLGTTFDVGPTDELVIVREIPFHSLCEHHLLGFSGTATIGYLPTDRVVGLSKLGRIVEVFARRLQVQERMTTQIADSIVEHLGADTVGVLIRARHSCMACRGIQKPAEMVTSKLTGRLREDHAMRAEFLALAVK